MAKAKELKPRNYVNLALMKRAGGAGAHVKTKKAQRREGKVALQKELKETAFPMLDVAINGRKQASIVETKDEFTKYADWKAAAKLRGDAQFTSKPGDASKTIVARIDEKVVGQWENVSGWVLKENIDLGDEVGADVGSEVGGEVGGEVAVRDEQDTITMDVPLLIRMFEVMREEVQSDEELHDIVERVLSLKNKGVLTMDDYEDIIPSAPSDEMVNPEEEGY